MRERRLPSSLLIQVWDVVNWLAVAGCLRGPGVCCVAVLGAGLGGILGPQGLSDGSTYGGGWLGRRGRRQADLDLVFALNNDFCATPCDEGVFVHRLVEERLK
jgi:hypothetical protein